MLEVSPLRSRSPSFRRIYYLPQPSKAVITNVRVRILKPLQGVVQGISLASLLPGITYDVDATLGGYLVSVGAADAVPAFKPARRIPLAPPDDHSKPLGGVPVTPNAEAADKPRRKRVLRRKKR